MHPLSRTFPPLRIPLAALWATIFCGCASLTSAQSLKITSNPPGATVDLNGVTVGATPLEKAFPGGYFHRTRTAFGSRLEHPMVARVSFAGFVTQEIQLTEGPMDWIDLHGRHHGQYWLFKSDHFHVDLETVAGTFTGSVAAITPALATPLEPELSLEELVRRTKPAVVYLKTLNGSGSGFFVTETGIIATNAHVARGDSSLLAALPNGDHIPAKVVYIDADLDLALVKAETPAANFSFPFLPLVDSSEVRQGESVLVIGNPGDAMLFSVTKGIVSAVGKFPAAGPGTWIQTDAQINPGNSGGPLVNGRGEVIGLNTLKVIRKNVTGIGFALSSGDLLHVLARFYPDLQPRPARKEPADSPTIRSPKRHPAEDVSNPPVTVRRMDAESAPKDAAAKPSFTLENYGSLTVTSNLGSARIFVDGTDVGNTPATLKLSAGVHRILVTCAGTDSIARLITIHPSGTQSIYADFAPANH